jgi:hypothetical protein
MSSNPIESQKMKEHKEKLPPEPPVWGAIRNGNPLQGNHKMCPVCGYFTHHLVGQCQDHCTIPTVPPAPAIDPKEACVQSFFGLPFFNEAHKVLSDLGELTALLHWYDDKYSAPSPAPVHVGEEQSEPYHDLLTAIKHMIAKGEKEESILAIMKYYYQITARKV